MLLCYYVTMLLCYYTIIIINYYILLYCYIYFSILYYDIKDENSESNSFSHDVFSALKKKNFFWVL